MENDKKIIGVLNKGKNNTFENCKFSDSLDIGIKNEGENLRVLSSDFGLSQDNFSRYNKLSKEELVSLLEERDRKKEYGLFWDDEKELEKVVVECRDNLPVLKRIESKEIRNDENDLGDNILIEGDNYHALAVLNYTHFEKIDVIYIDPPYNTGNKDFKYNDRFIEKEDGFRHSKWLNMMEKRLNSARELLSEEGTIFISIDDNELGQLKLLSDRIFGEENFVAIIPRISSYQRSGQENYMNVSHDYILCYSYALDFENNIDRKIQDNKKIKKDHIGTYVEGDTKAILAALSQGYSKGGDYDFEYNGKIYKPETSDGVRNRWLWKKERMEAAAKLGILVETKNSLRMQIYLDKKFEEGTNKMIEKNEKLIFHTADFMNNNVYTNVSGTQILNSVLGKDKFSNPKPLELIKKIISFSKNKNGIILDFFAGSGTTGHAVLELNKEDGGNRKFILCTNNENNICTEVTYPRLKKVIQGYKNQKNEKVSGLNGNLQYFETSLVKRTKNRDQTKLALTRECTEMLCLKENIFNPEIEKDDFKVFSTNKKDKYLCVYYNYINDSFGDFLKEISKIKEEKIIFMFSFEDEIDNSLFKNVENFTLEAIPRKILEVYEKLVKMNIPVDAEMIFTDFKKAEKLVFESKDKDLGGHKLRIVLEKIIQKIAQKNQVSVLTDKGKEIKLANINDILKNKNVFTKLEWEENKTYLTIGNHASHGEYDEFDLEQVNNFYRHVQKLIDKFGF